MRYAVTPSLLGVALVLAGVQCRFWGISLIWLGCDFLTLGVAHVRRAHGVFGKRSDGTLPLWSWMLFFPLHAYTSPVWHLLRLFSREPRLNRVSDELVVGRRLLAREIPGSFTNFVDLTAEFQEPRSLREAPGYVTFPILDASAPDPQALRAAVSRLQPGATFVHCAQGHGQTGLFALAVLLSSGAVKDVQEGLSMLANARPAIQLSPEQIKCVRAYADQLT